jgi:hypothetical protein
MPLRRLLVLAGLVCAVACASPAVAAGSPPTPVPDAPRPDLGALQGWVGGWSCSTKSSRHATAITGMAVYTFDPEGRWLFNTGTTYPVPWFPHNGASTEFITYDVGRKHWVDIYVDTNGNYQVKTSPGPTGNTWVWHDLGLQGTGDIESFGDATTTVLAKTLTTEYHAKTKTGQGFDVKTVCKRAA